MAESQISTMQLQALLDRGDDEAYQELLALASLRLHKLASKMLKGYPKLRRWEETDDVFQMSAIRLHQSLSSVRPRSVREFFGLAATQIRRTLIDLGRHYFGPQGHGANHASDPDVPAVAKSDSPENLLFWSQFHETVEQLPEEEREVFQLLWYAGTTQREAADLLGISTRTVLRRYYRARIFLQRTLKGANP
ncbi:sigma-70 family RNA polymerase sigma factor [Blastopirellula sp. JC732]|uniref:Sigma-70 family RNA polymerase sigma factor n=1 Tax=Blastopirellula sediminis TaxID=2894196 RepID=A0A9X1MT44_9BACT|nr:sigma-70 family RNA polymerase sigma factor [Blastopirellula sediminis]MCC9604691.1 sigma-70 family RNA polymerase sigma factor [Blastopirellula sediminis]MCC9632010.1 sigma-70 family RNA polymerase sigma factor [Blastopirellula sediminis]